MPLVVGLEPSEPFGSSLWIGVECRRRRQNSLVVDFGDCLQVRRLGSSDLRHGRASKVRIVVGTEDNAIVDRFAIGGHTIKTYRQPTDRLSGVKASRSQDTKVLEGVVDI